MQYKVYYYYAVVVKPRLGPVFEGYTVVRGKSSVLCIDDHKWNDNKYRVINTQTHQAGRLAATFPTKRIARIWAQRYFDPGSKKDGWYVRVIKQ